MWRARELRNLVVTKELEFHAGALPGHSNPDDEAERLPLNYFQLIIRYKWRLLAGFAVGVVLGHLLYLKAGPEYEAVAEILVKPKYAPPIREDQKTMRAGSLPSEHVKLIQSPMIASEAVKYGNLGELKSFRGETELSEAVLDTLKVKRIAGNDRTAMNVFDIRYTNKYSDDAAKVLEAVIAAYKEFLEHDANSQSREVQQLAKGAVESAEARLKRIEEEYNAFIQSVPAEFRSALGAAAQPVQTQSNVAPQDVIQRLGEEKNRNRIEMAELRTRKQAVEDAIANGRPREEIEYQVRRFLNAPGSQGGTENQNKSTEINIYQSQLMPLLLKERELERDFGRDWPELKTVRRNLETIVQTYRKLGVQLPEGVRTREEAKGSGSDVDLVAVYLADVKQQLIERQIKENELDRLLAEERNKAKEFASYQFREQELRGDLNSLKDLKSIMVENEAKVAIEKDTAGYQMSVLSPIKPALVLKRMLKFYSAGAAACLFLVALTCVLQELSDLTIKTVRDVRDILHQPVLGSVCNFVVPTDRASPTSGIPHPALRYLHAPSSVEAETFRSIRASLLVVTNNLHAKVVMVTSAEPGDGKTTLVSNLAVALAQSGKRVLLIDGDLRRPATHRILRLPQGPGLSEVLSGEATFDEVVRTTSIQQLSVMTTGTPPDNPAETLSLPAFDEVLEHAREEFDFVLVDAPPLLAVSDPCVMARATDGIVLVARLSKNTRSALIRVRQLLSDQDIPLIGAVVNGVPAAGGHEYGYTYYGEYAKPAEHPNAYAADSSPTSKCLATSL